MATKKLKNRYSIVSDPIDLNKGDDEKFKSHKYAGNPGKYFKETIDKIRGKKK